MTTLRAWLVGLIACWFSIGIGSTSAAETGQLPNIVYILCDDLGYGDVRCLNPDGKIATPNFDRIAREGMIFTDAHSGSAVCTPTRYGVMTGRYAWRSKLQSGVLGGLSPRLIEPGRETVASLLKKKGYQTACFGKWHLGMNWVLKPGKSVNELSIESREQVWNVDYTQPISDGPNAVGFEHYFGISASLDMVPYVFIKNDRPLSAPTLDKNYEMMLGRSKMTRLGPTAADFDAFDVLPRLTRELTDYIEQRSAAGKSASPFFAYVPLASPHTPIVPTAKWQSKSGLNPYADFVMETDAAVGRVLEALDRTGLAANTLVVLTSDNGCSPEADFDELLAKGHNPSHVFRGHKADIYEGGHRIPFLVRWPDRVKAGTKSDSIVCLTDLMATAADITGQKLAESAGEDSVSILPQLTGDASKPVRRSIVNHSINGSFAIRDGQWKLCLCPGSGGWSAPRPGRDDQTKLPPVQLFNLETDIAEKTNEQAAHPEIVDKLSKQLEEIVANGRSTPGAAQANTVTPNIWKFSKRK